MVEEQVFIIASANRIFLFTSSILDEYLSTIYGSKTLNAEKLSSLKTDLLTFPFEFMSDYYADITENLAKIIKVLANCIALPTFVAGVYGMNFEKMPELHWSFGYPLAILVMIMSCILPYFYIKKKKWL